MDKPGISAIKEQVTTDMRNASRTLAITISAFLLTASVVSCTSKDPDACDGKKPIPTQEEAVSRILSAASTGNTDEACSVIVGHPTTEEIAGGLQQLKLNMDESGINASNAVVEDKFQGGSLVQVRVSPGADTANSISMDLLSIRDEGYRFGWPLSFE